MLRNYFNQEIEKLLQKSDLKIDEIVGILRQIIKKCGRDLFIELTKVLQIQLLNRFLGKRRYCKRNKRRRNKETPWRCNCGNNESIHFSRKGIRKNMRKIKTSLGELEFPLYQIKCKQCGRVFAFLPEILGLKPYQSVTSELRDKLINVATKVSYNKAEKISDMLIEDGLISDKTIHKELNEFSDKYNFLDRVENNFYEALIIDSTGSIFGPNPRGSKIHVLIGIKRVETRKSKSGKVRVKIESDILLVKSGQLSKDDMLRLPKSRIVIFDGDQHYEKMFRVYRPDIRIKRCDWHILQEFSHFLYLDGLKHKKGKIRQDLFWHMRNIIRGEKQTTQEKKNSLAKFLTKEILGNGYDRTYKHMLNAIDYIFTIEDNHIKFNLKGYQIRTQNPLERIMREVKRRSKVGVRWSTKGFVNITKMNLLHNLS